MILLEETSEGFSLHCDPTGNYRKIRLDPKIGEVSRINNHLYTDGTIEEPLGLIVHCNEVEDVTFSDCGWSAVRDGKCVRTEDGATWEEDKTYPGDTIVGMCTMGRGFSVRDKRHHRWLFLDDRWKLFPKNADPWCCDGEYLVAETKIYRMSDWTSVNVGEIISCVVFQGHISWTDGSKLFQLIDGKPQDISPCYGIYWVKPHPHHLEVKTPLDKRITSDLKTWKSFPVDCFLLEDPDGSLWAARNGSISR